VTRAAPGWTVLELLRWTTTHFEEKGIETARIDAECLLAHALNVERLQLYLDFEKPVEEAERARFRELVRRRANDRVPVAYLTGRKEFWSLSLAVSEEVLIPRPDTEVLVAAGLERFPDSGAAFRMLDVGTGSGAVALAIASERPRAEITATDLSSSAIALARKNAETLGLAARVRFLEGDLLAPVRGERFDLVLANLPYVAEREAPQLAPELGHEPSAALYAGVDGLDLLRRFAVDVPLALAPGGAVALEMAPDQIEVVSALLVESGLGEVKRYKDLAGRFRVVSARAAEG